MSVPNLNLVPFSDAFIGPGCEYVIAPVARYAGVWKIPVLTAGAHAEAFENKPDYPTLTRMMGGYKMVGQAVKDILKVRTKGKRGNSTIPGIIFRCLVLFCMVRGFHLVEI